jgi:hypothetical protein
MLMSGGADPWGVWWAMRPAVHWQCMAVAPGHSQHLTGHKPHPTSSTATQAGTHVCDCCV